jgi:hypothetical protein
MEFIKVFDKVIAVDCIKCFEIETLDTSGIKVRFYLDDGTSVSSYKIIPRRIGREAFAEEVMSSIIRTINDLSNSQCEDIEDYLDYSYNDEEEENRIITDSYQLYQR